MTNSRTQIRAKIGYIDYDKRQVMVHNNDQYIEFCEQEDMDPDCYTSAVRWIENRYDK